MRKTLIYTILAAFFMLPACSEEKVPQNPEAETPEFVVPEGAIVLGVGMGEEATREMKAAASPVMCGEHGPEKNTRAELTFRDNKLNYGWGKNTTINIFVLVSHDNVTKVLPGKKLMASDNNKGRFLITEAEIAKLFPGKRKEDLSFQIATGQEEGVGNGAWFTSMNKSGEGEVKINKIDASTNKYSIPMYSDKKSYAELCEKGENLTLKVLGKFIPVRAKAETTYPTEIASIAVQSKTLRMSGKYNVVNNTWTAGKPMYNEINHPYEANIDTVGVSKMEIGGGNIGAEEHFSNIAYVWVKPADTNQDDIKVFVRDKAISDLGYVDAESTRMSYGNKITAKQIASNKVYGTQHELTEGHYDIKGRLKITAYYRFMNDIGARNIFEITNVSNKEVDLTEYYFVRYMPVTWSDCDLSMVHTSVLPFSSLLHNPDCDSYTNNENMAMLTAPENANLLVFFNDRLINNEEAKKQYQYSELKLAGGESMLIFACPTTYKNWHPKNHYNEGCYEAVRTNGNVKPKYVFGYFNNNEGNNNNEWNFDGMKAHVNIAPMTGTRSSCYFLTKGGYNIDLYDEHNNVVDNYGMIKIGKNKFTSYYTDNCMMMLDSGPLKNIYAREYIPSPKFNISIWGRTASQDYNGGGDGGSHIPKRLIGNYYNRFQNHAMNELARLVKTPDTPVYPYPLSDEDKYGAESKLGNRWGFVAGQGFTLKKELESIKVFIDYQKLNPKP